MMDRSKATGVTMTDWYYETMNYAAEGDHIYIAELMIELGAIPTSDTLKSACKRGHINMVNFLLDSDQHNPYHYDGDMFSFCRRRTYENIKINDESYYQ